MCESAFEIITLLFQFIARSAKDMNQWVVAIGLASSQPTPTVPHRVPERTVLGKRQLPSLPDSDSETYDDVGSTGKFNDDRQKNYEPVHPDDEELYHDIADVYQKGSEVQSWIGSEVKHTEEEPTVPPRRPVPSLHKDEPLEQDAVYDDVGVASCGSVYCNMISDGAGELQLQEAEESQTAKKEEEEDGEDIYDDIVAIEQAPEAIKLSAFHREGSGSNGSRILHIIRKMEASIGNGNKPSVGYHLKHAPLKQTETEELYEPIESGTMATSPTIPELPPRSNIVR